MEVDTATTTNQFDALGHLTTSTETITKENTLAYYTQYLFDIGIFVACIVAVYHFIKHRSPHK